MGPFLSVLSPKAEQPPGFCQVSLWGPLLGCIWQAQPPESVSGRVSKVPLCFLRLLPCLSTALNELFTHTGVKRSEPVMIRGREGMRWNCNQKKQTKSAKEDYMYSDYA